MAQVICTESVYSLRLQAAYDLAQARKHKSILRVQPIKLEYAV
jgi:hypothetical protein